MFGLKKSTNYGLTLMTFLAKNFGQGPIALKEIALKKELPFKFLEQIALSLRDSGLVEAKEGRGGGYFLKKKPKDIPIAEIVEVLEGPIQVGQCSGCPMMRVCGGQKDLWEEVGHKVKKAIEGKTLAGLI
jgi:Rrf2 family protein